TIDSTFGCTTLVGRAHPLVSTSASSATIAGPSAFRSSIGGRLCIGGATVGPPARRHLASTAPRQATLAICHHGLLEDVEVPQDPPQNGEDDDHPDDPSAQLGRAPTSDHATQQLAHDSNPPRGSRQHASRQ